MVSPSSKIYPDGLISLTMFDWMFSIYYILHEKCVIGYFISQVSLLKWNWHALFGDEYN